MGKRRAGFTVIEVVCVLVVVGVVAALAGPSMTAYAERIRVRSALDRLAAQVARARVQAVRDGERYEMRMLPARGCAEAYLLVRSRDGASVDSVGVEGGVCVSDNVARALVLDSRGMLVGSPRMIRARSGSQADSVSVSMAGRVYRWY